MSLLSTVSSENYLIVDYNNIGKEHVYLGSPLGKQVGRLPHAETVVKVTLIAAMVIGIALFAVGCIALGGVLTPTSAAELSRLCFYISTIASGLSMTSVELCLFLLSVGGALFIAGAIATIRGKIKDRLLLKKLDTLYQYMRQPSPTNLSDYPAHKRSALFRRLRLLYAHYEADRILEIFHQQNSITNISLLETSIDTNTLLLSEDDLKEALLNKLDAIKLYQLTLQYNAIKLNLSDNEKLSNSDNLEELEAYLTAHQNDIDALRPPPPVLYTENREFRIPIFVGTQQLFEPSNDDTEESSSET